MESSPLQPSSLTPRRDLLKLAMATGAGLAFGAASSSAQTAPASAETASKAKTYKFKLGALKPEVDTAGGTVAECDKRVLPVLEHGGAALFLLKLKPGGLREPHWHPNCWEFDYVVSGTVQMTIVPPDGPADTFTLEPGDIAFVPQGYAHSILNIGDVEAVIPITFNSALPSDIGLSTMYGNFPPGQFTQTFGVPAADMANIPRPKKTLFIAPKI